MNALVPVAFVGNPISGDIWREVMPEGRSLFEIVASVPDLPDRFHDFGTVVLERKGQPQPVPRAYWAKGHCTKNLWPKADAEFPVTVYLYMPPGKSGGGGSKSVIALVATIALVAVGALITGGGLAGLGGLAPGFFTAGSLSAQVLAGAVGLIGRLAITLAATPAAQGKNTAQAPTLGSAGADGNLLAAGSSPIRACGEVKVYPQLAALPLVELSGDDEFVEAPYLMGGPHAMKNIEIEGAPIEDISDVQYIVNDGTEAQRLSILSRYGVQRTPQFELQAHKRNKTIPRRLEDQNSPESSLPKPYGMTTRFDPDEIWLQYLWPGGMTDSTNNVAVAMSIRYRLRMVGTSNFINLPELMFQSKLTGRISKKVVLTWDDPPSPINDTPQVLGAWHSFHTVPGQDITPLGLGAWAADASFIGTPGVANATARVKRSYDGFTVYLDPAVFPRGHRWYIEETRSCLSRVNDWGGGSTPFVPTTYKGNIGASVYSLFDYWDLSGIKYTANGNNFYADTTLETCILMRFASVWKRSPLPLGGDASIEVRGKNINVQQLSCLAAGLVKRYDGAGFTDFGPSSWPADHFYDVLTNGNLTNDPVPAQYVNVPELAAWRQACVDNNWQIAAAFDGRDWRETLEAIAATGLAKKREGRLWGVVRERDTTLIDPRQSFSPRNANNFTLLKSFTPVPDAFRISYRDRDQDWDPEELLVVRPGLTAAEAKLIVAVDAVGIDRTDQIDTFYRLYLASMFHRDYLLTFDTWFEALVAERGDVIEISHVMLDRNHIQGRILDIEYNGSDEVTAITMDIGVEPNEEDGLEVQADLDPLADLAALGRPLGAALITDSGTISMQAVAEVQSISRRIEFEVPFIDPGLKREHIVMLGTRGEETLRCILTDVKGSNELMFGLTCHPETPVIYSELTP